MFCHKFWCSSNCDPKTYFFSSFLPHFHPLPPFFLPSYSQRMSCSYLLCTILLFVAVLLAVTVTGTILFMNHYQAPPMSDGLPHISTNQDEANALVTVERGDGSRINIFIDPNCPDYNSNFLRLEGVQTSLLHSLTDHDSDLKSVKGQDRALLVNLAEEVAKLSAHAGQLKMDYESLRRGQGSLGQDLNTLQTEQGRLIQVRHIRVNMHTQTAWMPQTQSTCSVIVRSWRIHHPGQSHKWVTV